MEDKELKLKALSYLLPVARKFGASDSDDFFKWLETFKGKSECIDFLDFIDSGLYTAIWNIDPNKPVEENHNITHHDVMEALCYEAIRLAKESICA